MPLMNSMGALKQQKNAGSITFENFYSAVDFNLTVDSNDVGTTTINNIPYIYGSSSDAITPLCFVGKLNSGTGKFTLLQISSDDCIVRGLVQLSTGDFVVLRTYGSSEVQLLKYLSLIHI